MAPIILTEKDKARFFSKLRRDEATGCLLWTGGTCANGYATFNVRGRNFYVHRVAFTLARGPVDDQILLHVCDNPLCCEPAHLQAGTQAENLADMARKGRGRKNRSGLPFGVHRNKKRFSAKLRWGNVVHYLGTFDSPEVAHAAVMELRAQLFSLP